VKRFVKRVDSFHLFVRVN